MKCKNNNIENIVIKCSFLLTTVCCRYQICFNNNINNNKKYSSKVTYLVECQPIKTKIQS